MNYAHINECFRRFSWSSLSLANVISGELRSKAASEITAFFHFSLLSTPFLPS